MYLLDKMYFMDEFFKMYYLNHNIPNYVDEDKYLSVNPSVSTQKLKRYF